MARTTRKGQSSGQTQGGGAVPGGDLPFAKELFESADRMRGSVESAEYKHLVLGLLFLKYISDAFERRRDWLDEATRDRGNRDYYTDSDDERQGILEDRDEYISENVFWVPELARWPHLLKAASRADIGQAIDKALEAIERDNAEQLRGVLPKVYGRAPIQPAKLGALVETIARIGFGDSPDEARDVLGRTYEYFIREFARAEGHRGGEFYTPRSVTRLLVEMLEPYEGRVLDPACGSGGLFIQSAGFVTAHGGRARQISILGQENNQATWRICKMNLAIHGISGDVRLGDSLLDDRFPGVRADFVIANPPFNMKKWGADAVSGDSRWEFGEPPDQNANYAWIQHFINHLTPTGRAGFVMANGSLTSVTNGEGSIREGIVDADLVDCVVALPPQLFFTTAIPVSLWFVDRDKTTGSGRPREGEMLLIDARALGHKISKTQIALSEDEVGRIAGTYHLWRDRDAGGTYEDVPGFCKVVTRDEVKTSSYALNPGRYVGAPELVTDLEELQTQFVLLSKQIREELTTSDRLSGEVRDSLDILGLEGDA